MLGSDLKYLLFYRLTACRNISQPGEFMEKCLDAIEKRLEEIGAPVPPGGSISAEAEDEQNGDLSPVFHEFLEMMTRGDDSTFISKLAAKNRAALMREFYDLKQWSKLQEAEEQMELFSGLTVEDFMEPDLPGMFAGTGTWQTTAQV